MEYKSHYISLNGKMKKLFFLLLCMWPTSAFRYLESGSTTPNGSYFVPFKSTPYVGIYGDPSNLQRERINEGAYETPSQELLFEGPSPRQVCPGMVGPFSDGNYYCSAREYGYCDRRSGTCLCNIGYQGIDCSECQATHFLIGSLCFPKKLCPNDCSGAGTCNYYNGTCSCSPHRYGDQCEKMLCSRFSPLCQSCTPDECLLCAAGYYLTLDSRVCSTCYDFDPRCAGCTKDLGCTTCSDPVLTSIRRSGYRSSDPRLPIEEDVREFSITLPFGTKSPESFADAENFFVCALDSDHLKDHTTTCAQGLSNDESWDCTPFQASHKVCGHLGVFKFAYPNYVVKESDKSIRMSVERSGGGYGDISINYYVYHFTTNDSDVTPTAPYTTSQTLSFGPGIVQRTFLINILDDISLEADEVFQVVLETPVGGGSIGAQFRANVTILDDDSDQVAPMLTRPIVNQVEVAASHEFSVLVQAMDTRGNNKTLGGEKFLSVVENDAEMWTSRSVNVGVSPSGQRHGTRTTCSVIDNNNGSYTIRSSSLTAQGHYQLRTWFAFPGGLMGKYYSDAFFQTMALQRIDRHVNFTWGTGRLIPRGADYVSIRWVGAIMSDETGIHHFKVEAQDHVRLWIDGELLMDHFHMQAANSEFARIKYLTRNVLYEVILEYRKVRGAAHARFLWSTPNDLALDVVPSTHMYSLYDIANNPVDVTVKSDITSAPHTECTGSGLYRGEVLKRSEFHICPRDRFGNLRDDDNEIYLASELFSATLTLVDDSGHHGVGSVVLTPVIVYNHDTHCFDAQYTPERGGKYRLDISYQTWHYEALQPVAGSPFYPVIKPTKTSGPYSQVFHLPAPLLLEAGLCHNFTIVARDFSRNLKLTGGDDFQVYMYQVDYYSLSEGPEMQQPFSPSFRPTLSPTSAPSRFLDNSHRRESPLIETLQPVVRNGLVMDLNNGNYTALVCPVVAGWYEVHVLLNGRGVSNQPHRVLDLFHSLSDNQMGDGVFRGQYVDSSPYTLVVKHSTAVAHSCNAVGVGLRQATVGIPASFMVTTRDGWDNVLRTRSPACNVSAVIAQSPNASTTVWNYLNGSYLIEYVAEVSGLNEMAVLVDGFHIPESPFLVNVVDGRTSESYSYCIGTGLSRGTTGEMQYFELFAFDFDGNRKSLSDDTFVYYVSGANNISGVMTPCPYPANAEFFMCNQLDSFQGHYFAGFTPTYSGEIVIDVFFVDASGREHRVSNAPFHAKIMESHPAAAQTVISGTLYDNVAGVWAEVQLELHDKFANRITTGSAALELVLYGVGVEWGTIQPWNSTPGLQDAYHYKGFYAGYPDVYGLWVDHLDGRYTARYNAPKAGQYVMRLSITEPGLNVTYFNDTTFGVLLSGSSLLMPGLEADRGFIPVNFGTSISWTGDIGGRPGVIGDRGEGTYWNYFGSKVDSVIDIDLSLRSSQTGGAKNASETLTSKVNKFRERYWSARWFGLIKPLYAERYTFTVRMDTGSTVHVAIGGVGVMLNGSRPGESIIRASSISSVSGDFSFSDDLTREFLLEYSHTDGFAQLQLYWESPSTPFSIIPPEAFSHWVNISHYNTTIHPAPLCPSCSTAYGEGLSRAMVASMSSFVVYARDSFGNLMQIGDDVPSLLAVGKDGVAFRGQVTDYGNSTYLIEYYPTVAGQFLLYVTMGCCPPHPNVGFPAELDDMQPLLISGAPFKLTVASGPIVPSRSVAVGVGVLGGIAGYLISFTVLLRDLHNNPTTNLFLVNSSVSVTFQRITDMDFVDPAYLAVSILEETIVVTYNMSRAGKYVMHVKLATTANPDQIADILGSPFTPILSTGKVYPPTTICKGFGIKQAAQLRAATFDVNLHDVYNNAVGSGGTKFYMRLVGDNSYTSHDDVIPTCKDYQNGKYHCSYTPLHSGYHELVVKVLNGSFSHPGGNGLTGRYYDSDSGVIDSFTLPLLTQIDPVLDLAWPNGSLVPSPLRDGVRTMLSTGSYVRWDGFVVAPRTEEFLFTVQTVNLNATVYIDSFLVFDSAKSLSFPINLVFGSAYTIAVTALSSPNRFNAPASLTLLWSANTLRQSVVDQFFLFDSAEEIPLSPFPVAVV